MPTPAAPTSGKLESLESIRGLAALFVVFSHLALVFLPAAHQSSADSPSFLAILTRSPLRILYDGEFAVRIFFVLSGIVLSMAFFRRPGAEILAAAAVRRYFRLTLPIFTSVLFSYALLASGAYANRAAAELMGRPPGDWLAKFYAFPASLSGALVEGSYGVYFRGGGDLSLNPILWSMSVELYGSYFVFAFLALAGSLRRRWIIYLILGVLFHQGPQWRFSFDFLAGIAICDFYINGPVGPQRLGSFAGAVMLITGVVIATLQAGWFNEPIVGILIRRKSDCQTLGAMLIILAALYAPHWGSILEWRPFVSLGRLSFSLYLLHFPILFSLGCRTFITVHLSWGYSVAAAKVIAGIVVVVTTIAAGEMMYRLVDRRSIELGKRVYAYFKPLPAAEKC